MTQAGHSFDFARKLGMASEMVEEMTRCDAVEFAAEQQRRFDASTCPQQRKERGHFGTPPVVAKFLAGMFSEASTETLRILDPGAGVGTLSAALCQRLLNRSTCRSAEFELWENDPALEPYLRRTMEHCRSLADAAGFRLTYEIRGEDFILANAQKSLFETGPEPKFHWALLNPPYYKVRKESAQARAMQHIVHGQPNVYAFFMAVAADLLLPGGQMVAITPRSYFSGAYFKRFRKWFFERMVARHIHVFQSRAEAFKGDDVLQENVILFAERAGDADDVVLTSSFGRSLENVERSLAPLSAVFDNSHGDLVVRVTTCGIENEIVAALDRLPRRFRNIGFEISTGPVVTFRSTEFLRHERSHNTAPLLWMHNVRPFLTRFPAKNGKPTHIVVSDGSKRLLVPAKRYVLLKRFTSKEEKRRLVAGIMDVADSYSPWVGFENHLNYVYDNGAGLAKPEALGLAAIFNSALVDRYFRAVSGNTQVNASDVRGMPMPDRETVARIGAEVEKLGEREPIAIERVVGSALGLPDSLLQRLCGMAQ